MTSMSSIKCFTLLIMLYEFKSFVVEFEALSLNCLTCVYQFHPMAYYDRCK